jgi:hypothetical protein
MRSSTRLASKIGALLIGILVLGSGAAHAESLSKRQNLTELIEQSDAIVHGDVVSVTDGVENRVPYTEITVKVREMLRGTAASTITFRQFGLLEPRVMPNGLVNYAVTPRGWASYKPSEEVVLFLYKRARVTGLRTTVGLGQGKFTILGGNVLSQEGNVGLFDGVELDSSVTGKRESEMIATKGAVNADAFLSLVRRAIADKWIETRMMRNAK